MVPLFGATTLSEDMIPDGPWPGSGCVLGISGGWSSGTLGPASGPLHAGPALLLLARGEHLCDNLPGPLHSVAGLLRMVAELLCHSGRTASYAAEPPHGAADRLRCRVGGQ